MNVRRFKILLTCRWWCGPADARDEAAILAHVVREFGRVEDDTDVEEREQNDQNDVNQVVERLAKADGLAEILDEGVPSAKNQRRRGGKRQQRAAKIGGITPPELTRNGKYEDCPPMTLRPTTRLAYCTGMRRCPPSTKTMKATTATISATRKIRAMGVNGPQAPFWPVRKGSGWRAADPPQCLRYDERHAISDSALADLFAQPHDERRTGS